MSREVYLPREHRRMTWAHVKRLQDAGAAEGRDFRCECCGEPRELVEAMMVGIGLMRAVIGIKFGVKASMVEFRRPPPPKSKCIIVCLTCYGEAEQHL